MLCAEHAVRRRWQAGRAERRGRRLRGGLARLARSAATSSAVRNVKPLWSRLGTVVGVALGGLDMWLNELFGWSPFGTMRHGKPDYATLKPLAEVEPIVYPKPDGVLTFDRLSSVFLSNTNHEEDQPSHLKLADPTIPIRENLPRLRRAGPTLLPGRRLRGRLRRRRAAHRPEVRDQRPELRPLQNLRHQGPGPEHQLGDPRKAEAGRTTSRCEANRAPSERRLASPEQRVCADRCESGWRGCTERLDRRSSGACSLAPLRPARTRMVSRP